MGEKIILQDGILTIYGNDSVFSFECDLDQVYEEHTNEIFPIKYIPHHNEVACTVKVNTKLLYKLSGLYDWAYDNCPNRRVRHLMRFGKTNRVRWKNFRRALRVIGKMLEE